MTPKRIFQVIVDLAMTAMLPVLMAYALVGEAAHEWVGICSDVSTSWSSLGHVNGDCKKNYWYKGGFPLAYKYSTYNSCFNCFIWNICFLAEG